MASSFLAYFGHVNIDVSIRVPKMPRVGSVNATNVTENFGGTAGNFAIVANRLGLDFDLYSAVSPKTHAGYMEYLESRGISTGHIDQVHGSYGPVCYIPSDGDEQIAYIFQGPMEEWSPAATFKDDMGYRWVHFSTGPPKSYLKIFDHIGGSFVTFDPGQEIHYRYDSETTSKFIKRADMFIGNRAEYDKLMEITGWSDEKIKASMETVIITRGADGVTAYHGNRELSFSALPAESVHDTIGAGDSFRAGLYSGLNNGLDLEGSILAGIVVASKAVEKPLTQFEYTFEEIEKLIERNRAIMSGK